MRFTVHIHSVPPFGWRIQYGCHINWSSFFSLRLYPPWIIGRMRWSRSSSRTDRYLWLTTFFCAASATSAVATWPWRMANRPWCDAMQCGRSVYLNTRSLKCRRNCLRVLLRGALLKFLLTIHGTWISSARLTRIFALTIFSFEGTVELFFPFS